MSAGWASAGSPPARAHDGHRLGRLQLRAGDVGRAVVADVAVEGLLDAADVAALDQGPGDVGPADGAPLAGDGLHARPGHVEAQVVQALHDALAAPQAVGPLQGEAVGELRIVVVQEVAEDVQLTARGVRVDLHPGDDFERRALRARAAPRPRLPSSRGR